jgi:exodeoxyribonuclease-3
VRIATWNVNSLSARLDKVWWWLERARPDVLLLQETKLADAAAPTEKFAAHGYKLAHHGEGRWNGVAIASRIGIDGVVARFGDPDGEARMISALCGGVRVVCIYAPNGQKLDTEPYRKKLVWYERLSRWLTETCAPADPIVLGGDYNIAPTDADVWDPAACHGGTHVSAPERAAFQKLTEWGLVDAYRLKCSEPERFSWWDYRAGMFYKNYGMRIDHLLVTSSVAGRVVHAEIDRMARKGKPTPSDHAPAFVDLDELGTPVDGGWADAAARIAERRRLRAKPTQPPR